MSIIRLLSLVVLFVCALTRPTQAQTATDLNEGLQVVPNPSGPPGSHTISWWGRTGVAYFIQTSLDLHTWTYVPLIESGSNAILTWGFQSNAERLFVRLYCRPGYNPSTAATSDSDSDGVTDQDELNLGTDPFNLLGPNGQPEWWSQHTVPPLYTPNQTPPTPLSFDLGPVADSYSSAITPFPTVADSAATTSTAQLGLQTRRREFNFGGSILGSPLVPDSSWAVWVPYQIQPLQTGSSSNPYFDPVFGISTLEGVPFGSSESNDWQDWSSATDYPPSIWCGWFEWAEGPYYETSAFLNGLETRLTADQPAPPAGLKQTYLVIQITTDYSSNEVLESTCVGRATLVIPQGQTHSTQVENVFGSVAITGSTYKAIALKCVGIGVNQTVEQFLVPVTGRISPDADESLVNVLSTVGQQIPVSFNLNTPAFTFEDPTPPYDCIGGQIVFSILGPGSLQSPAASLNNQGRAATILTPPGTPGSTATLRARVMNLELDDWFGNFASANPIDCSHLNLTFDSDPIRYIHAAPKVELSPATTTLVADATDTVTFTATGTDTLNNPLPDGTPVTWLINGAPAQIAQASNANRQIQTQLLNGSATATLRSPAAAGTLSLTAQIGPASDTATITSTVPTAQITSTASTLDIAQGDSATLTINTDAADGTVVNWFASNGTLAQRATVVTGGTTTTTLLSSVLQGAREGPVGVIATIGSRVVSWAGSFIYTAPVKIELDELYLAGAGQSTFARIKVPGHPNARAHVFINGAQVITLAPVNNALVPDNTVHGIGIQLDANGEAVIQVTSTLEPGLAANAQIHVEIETGVVEGVPTLVETDTWISVVNFDKHQAAADFFVGALGGDIEGGSGMLGSIAGGFLLVGDAGGLGKNVGRLFGIQEGDFDGFEFTLIAAGVLCSGTPLDAVPTVSRAILAILKTLPADQSVKAVKILRSCYKLLLTDRDAVPQIWSLFQRIFTDSDLIKAVFKAADGSLETFKQIAESYTVYGNTLLAYLKDLPLNQADQIANAGKTVKCLNDAGPTFKSAIQASGRALATVMDEVAVIIKGGTNVAERIDSATLVYILQKLVSRANSLDYKVTHFTNHLATLLSKNPNIRGLFSKAPGSPSVCLVDNIFKQLHAPNFGVLGGNLLHLQEAAKLAQSGQTISFLEKSEGQFMDIVLNNDSRFYEVKLSFETLVGKDAANIPAAATREIVDIVTEAIKQGRDPNKLTYLLGQGWNGSFPPMPPAIITAVQQTFPGMQFVNVPFKNSTIPYFAP